MADGKTQELLRTIQYGTGARRLVALIQLGDSQAEVDDILEPLLNLIASEYEDGNDKLWAAIALTKRGYQDELIRDDCLLRYVDIIADSPSGMSPIGRLEQQVLRALSLFHKNPTVSERLIKAAQKAGSIHHAGGFANDSADFRVYETRDFIRDCIRAVGVIGYEDGRDFLRYWKDQGNSTASAALDRFGQPWDVIARYEEETEKPPKRLESASPQQIQDEGKKGVNEPQKKGFFRKLFG